VHPRRDPHPAPATGDEVAIIGKVMAVDAELPLLRPGELPADGGRGSDRTRLCLERLKEVTIQFGSPSRSGRGRADIADHASGDLVAPGYYLRICASCIASSPLAFPRR